MLTGRLLHSQPEAHDLRAALRRFAARSGEPVVRQAVTAAMRILARQFVMGRTIEEALERARAAETSGLPAFLRYARRGRAYRGRCGALSRRL